jgi:hypothetical protein
MAMAPAMRPKTTILVRPLVDGNFHPKIEGIRGCASGVGDVVWFQVGGSSQLIKSPLHDVALAGGLYSTSHVFCAWSWWSRAGGLGTHSVSLLYVAVSHLFCSQMHSALISTISARVYPSSAAAELGC